MKEIEQILREVIGLDPEALGSAAIPRAVRLQMNALGLREVSAYEQLLRRSSVRRTELVEAVIVSETWFFREPSAFAALTQWVAADSSVNRRVRPLRLLSLPCSTGEEPYSAAMALLDAGLPAARFQIEAVDISERALDRARRAVYGKNSFRGADLGFRERHFQTVSEGFALRPSVRAQVHFVQGNLLSDSFLARDTSYDFIFCRNLLIYFDPPTRHRALKRLEQLLTPGGFLFVGPAEHPLPLAYGFESAHIPMAFACRKPSLTTGSHPVRAEQRCVPALTLPPVGQNPPAATDLDQARRLADGGHLDKAAALCEAHLRQNAPSAHAYFLLGLVRDAGGNADALECYRKALYLEPNHYDTLLQMAMLAQKNGDNAGARNFLRRAQRGRTST